MGRKIIIEGSIKDCLPITLWKQQLELVFDTKFNVTETKGIIRFIEVI